jgi:nitrogen fixation/metabolism regulation signal transduction histidine kinase
MNQAGYALLGLTAIVAVLVAVLAFAMLRFAANARAASSHLKEGGAETAFLTAALQEAVAKLRSQEQAMSARAAASEQLSEQIVQSLTAGLLVVDGRDRVEILNPAGRELLGITTDPVGMNFRELLQPVAPLVHAIGECLMTRRPILRRSIEVVSGDRALQLGVSVSPLGGDEGRGVICLFSDLTNVFELEEQLRMKETLARLGELTAGIAHEFRNGLATIHGYSRLIVLEALPPQYQPYVEGIRQETEALGKVVTNFLNFARPEKVSFSRVDVGSLARRVGEDLRRELPEGTSVDVAGQFEEIDGDEVLLRQMFSNLVRNAADACEEAGVTPAIRIEGRVDSRRRTLSVSVGDNGPGVPEASRARVFQPFFTTRSSGTGLGLAIVQKIVVMHNGRVTLGASAAGGASFNLMLPLGSS